MPKRSRDEEDDMEYEHDSTELQLSHGTDYWDDMGRSLIHALVLHWNSEYASMFKLHDTFRLNLLKTYLNRNCVDVNNCDKNGMSALHLAVHIGDIEALQAMLYLGVDTAIKDSQGHTAVQYALLKQDTDTVCILMNHYVLGRKTGDCRYNSENVEQPLDVQMPSFMSMMRQ
jgi:ankyrin repeat protein